MSTLARALLLVASAVLVVEFLLTAAAGLLVLAQGVERFAHLTGLTPSPTGYRLMGLLALAGVAGIIAGIWRPVLAVPAAAYFAVLSGFTVVRQLQRGQRGRELLAYTLFLISALIVLAVRASEARM
jgi:hypothetical protein